MRWLTLAAVRVALLFRAVAPGRLLQRIALGWVRMESACCRADSTHFKFMRRYLERFERAGTFERVRAFLRRGDPARAAARIDAWVRMGLAMALRHEVLQRHLGTPGVPPKLIYEAQLALSPGCDLACEGCYTEEERGGQAPRRARIAVLVDEVVRAGAFVVHVVGKGEPFLSPAWAGELLDVIAARPHVLFTLATHGMHVTDEQAARMGRMGNLVLLVAVDGPEPLHDARRGAGSYRRVQEKLALLRRHDVVFGFICMVSAKSWRAVTSPAFVAAQAAAGCAVGIYSRYFPLSASSTMELALDGSSLSAYRREFDARAAAATIPLLDLDDVEEHTGCHSRSGGSVYVDGITGQVAPCLRVPFAPADCRVDPEAGARLADALAHPYFVAYRAKRAGCPSWCGANLDGELAAVGELLDAHGAARPERLGDYVARSRDGARRLHLPVLPPTEMSS